MQVSIIIPVYQENDINNRIDSILSQTTSIDFEIIIVDGDNRSTLELIDNDQVIQVESMRLGRSYQMNEGFKHASGDILLFLHTNTILPNNALESIVKALEPPSTFKAGAFDIAYDSENKIVKKIGQLASWRTKNLKLPFGNQAIFVKKEVFENIGGYKEIDFMEDINFIQKLKRKKYKIVILDDVVLTNTQAWESKTEIITTLRNLVLQALYFVGIHPNKLAKFYK